MTLPVGQLVLLIGTDGFMPPFGAIGSIVEPMDDEGDYGVLFPKYPCPSPPGPHWYAHRTWLVPLNPPQTADVVGGGLLLVTHG